MKLALIGAGQRGSIYAHYAKEKCNAQIVAVVDISEEKRQRTKSFSSFRVYLKSNLLSSE